MFQVADNFKGEVLGLSSNLVADRLGPVMIEAEDAVLGDILKDKKQAREFFDKRFMIKHRLQGNIGLFDEMA